MLTPYDPNQPQPTTPVATATPPPPTPGATGGLVPYQAPTGTGLTPLTQTQDTSSQFGNLPKITATPDTSQKGFLSSHPWLSAIWGGLTDVVSQPATAVQAIGTGIGQAVAEKVPLPGERAIASAFHLTPEKMQAEQTALQRSTSLSPGSEGQQIQPTTSLKQGAGQVVQAAANLATPLALEAGPAGLAAQVGTLEAGKAMEEGRTPTETAIAAGEGVVLGYAGGKLGEVAGTAVEKGLTGAKQAMAGLAKKLAPLVTQTTKADWKFATEEAARVLPKFQAVKEAVKNGDPAGVQVELRQQLKQKAQSVIGAGEKAFTDAWEKSWNAITKKFANVRADGEGIKAASDAFLKEDLYGRIEYTGTGGKRLKTQTSVPSAKDPYEVQRINDLQKQVNSWEDWSLTGLKDLKNRVWQFTKGAEKGDAVQRFASNIYSHIAESTSEMTKGATDPLMKSWSEFADKAHQLGRLNSPNENQALNFAANLESKAQGGARQAVEWFEKQAKQPGELMKEVRATRVANALAQSAVPTGSRLREVMLALGLAGGSKSIGEAIAGPIGGSIAEAGSLLIGAHMLAPQTFADLILSEAEKTVPQSATRQALGKMIKNPAVQQVLMRVVKGLMENQPQTANQTQNTDQTATDTTTTDQTTTP